MRAGIAVPIPGAAEIAALLDDADIGDAGLDQPRAGDQPGEAAADESESDVIGLRRAFDEGRVRVCEIMRKLALQLQILRIAVGRSRLSRSSMYFASNAFLSIGCLSAVVFVIPKTSSPKEPSAVARSP
ncbi:MAG: hypothetical protein WDN69_19725 [Aliidongia sp.]